MKLFDVYPLYPITPVRAKGFYVWDINNEKYLDLYGGHAVISIGHSHPKYVKAISEQVAKLGFYSNSIQNPLQQKVADLIAELSGLETYSLFLCNSGAEANENAIKLASFHTGKSKIIAFEHSFHGRTSAALALTDNPKIVAPVNNCHQRVFLPLNNAQAVEDELKKGDIAAVIIEGIRGVGGMAVPEKAFMQKLEKLCKTYSAVLILDEIQSGCGRSGTFFAFEKYGIKPSLVTMAKGIANGFPVGAVLISPEFEAKSGMLGTTFGGSHLACCAAIATLQVIRDEKLTENAMEVGRYAKEEFTKLPFVESVVGEGLMLAINFEMPVAELRKRLIFEKKIFTGSSSNAYQLRILPPLCIGKEQINEFCKLIMDILK